MINLRIVKNLEAVSQELGRLLDQMFVQTVPKICPHGRSWFPPMDIYETDEAYLLVGEVPGLLSEDVDLVVDRHHLKVAGQRRGPYQKEALRIHQSEIHYGFFQRLFRMPGPIRPHKVSAEFDNGYLVVRLPKARAGSTKVKFEMRGSKP